MTHWKDINPGRFEFEPPINLVHGMFQPRIALKAVHENKLIYTESVNGPIESRPSPIVKALNALVEKYDLKRISGTKDEDGLSGTFLGEETYFQFTIGNSIYVHLETLNEPLVTDLRSLKLGKKISWKMEHQQVKIVAKHGGGFIAWPMGVASKKFNRDHYNSDTVKEYDYVVSELKKEEPFGRLAIFHGPPGTGKTHILRAIMDDLDYNKFQFLYVPTELLTNAKMADLTSLFIQQSGGRKLVLLIEDAETILQQRAGTGERTDAISNLLNLADGFIGNTLDMRIICTTNLAGTKIDEALTRPGRLISSKAGQLSEVKALEAKEAQVLYKKLTGEETTFAGPRTIAQVYAYSKGLG